MAEFFSQITWILDAFCPSKPKLRSSHARPMPVEAGTSDGDGDASTLAPCVHTSPPRSEMPVHHVPVNPRDPLESHSIPNLPPHRSQGAPRIQRPPSIEPLSGPDRQRRRHPLVSQSVSPSSCGPLHPAVRSVGKEMARPWCFYYVQGEEGESPEEPNAFQVRTRLRTLALT